MRRSQSTAVSASEISRQANMMRGKYPELYAYLARRDETLRRALAGVPDEEDVELCATQRPFRQIEASLRGLEPGIAEIAG